MAQEQDTISRLEYQAALLDNSDFLREIVTHVLQNILDHEILEHLSADRYERTGSRKGYRNGSYPRSIKTRVGCIDLLVPRDREGNFQTSLFSSYQRSEQSLLLSLMEMTINGVSTRKVTKITEQLCGTSFSKSLVSSLCVDLDAKLEAWRNRPITGKWPYIYVDAIYEKGRCDHHIRSIAVLIAKGVNELGLRSVLGVKVCTSENSSDYADFFRSLIERGLSGVQLVISDDHSGLVKAINSSFQGASWQRCMVHFQRNLFVKLRKDDRSDIMSAMRDVYNAPDGELANIRIREVIEKLSKKSSDVSDWLEESVQDTLSYFNFPSAHRKRIRSTNCLERLNEEIRRRSRVIRIYPNAASCLRMSTALCQEYDEEWTTGKRYLDMSLLLEAQEDISSEKIRRAV